FSFPPVDDAEVLSRLKAGEQDAFEAIFKLYYAQLVGVAENMLRDRQGAEDVVQDVMVELWRRREALTVEASIRAYLFRSVRNRALNQIRHQRVAPTIDPDAADRVPTGAADRHLETSELKAALRKAVAGLPDRCRE